MEDLEQHNAELQSQLEEQQLAYEEQMHTLQLELETQFYELEEAKLMTSNQSQVGSRPEQTIEGENSQVSKHSRIISTPHFNIFKPKKDLIRVPSRSHRRQYSTPMATLRMGGKQFVNPITSTVFYNKFIIVYE